MATEAKIVVSGDYRGRSAFQQLQADLAAAEQRSSALSGIFSSLAARLALPIAAGAGLFAFIKSTADGIDRLNDLKDATGSSIENLSALEDVARRTGTGIDVVGDALVKFNNALNSAQPGSVQASALKALNLEATQLKALDPSEALRRVAVALAGYADDGNKARLVQELFGKSLRQVAPFLNDLATQSRLLAKATTESAQEAEKFNQQLFAFQKNSEDAHRALLGLLLPAINQTIDKFKEGAAAGKGFFETLRDQQLKLLGIDVDVRGAQQLRAEIEGIDALLAKGVMMDQRRVALQEKRAQLAAKLNDLEARQINANPAFRPSQNYGDALKPSLPAQLVEPETVKKAREAYLGLAESIGLAANAAAEELATGEKLSPLQQLRTRVLEQLSSAQVQFTAAQRQSLQAAADGLDVLDKEVKAQQALLDVVRQRAQFKAKDYQDANDAATANEQAARDRVRSLLQATPSGQLKQTLRDINLINDAKEKGYVNEQEAAEIFRNLTAQLNGQTEQSIQLAQDLGDAFASAAENAVLNFSSVGDVLKSLEKDIERILFRRFVTQPLTNAIANGALGLFGSANGNAFGPGGVIPFASGGIVQQPTFFNFGPTGRRGVMGEAGPEAVLPLKRGADGKLGVQSAGGRGDTTIIVQGDVGARALRAMQVALAQRDARMADAARY